ncbi:hypothetical protein B0A49_12282 [Cryomyces minteri]|uniref:DUF7707 domain-containing protein n=1 Tax=Cryomyces minteri TaxID=331657 RepID=A0A4U0VNP0_9PEZI|nr:hypothetical protein B0A49_12282 [Cryomyces minteri]
MHANASFLATQQQIFPFNQPNMFFSTLLFAATAFSGLVAAQNATVNTSIDPNSVSIQLRQSWCRAQTNSCPQICGGQASPNTCDPNSLQYQCTCSDGSSYNISDYSQTLPSLECEQYKVQCVAAHPNDLNGQTACLAITCGQRNATSGASASSSASSSSATATSSGAASSSGSAGSSATSAAAGGASSATSAAAASSTAKSAAVLNAAMNYGTLALAGGMLALFGFAL